MSEPADGNVCIVDMSNILKIILAKDKQFTATRLYLGDGKTTK